MHLTLYTHYSLRILTYAGLKRDGVATIQEIAGAFGISKNHVRKAVHRLGVLGYLETTRGRGGGIRLAQDPDSINIGKVVSQTEEQMVLCRCFAAGTGSCPIEAECRMRDVFRDALDAFLKVLGDYTLADLLAPGPRLAQMLSIETPARDAPVPAPT